MYLQMLCILIEFYKNWFRDKRALDLRLRQPTNARFKLRNSQNRKWADENSSKQVWIKMAWTIYQVIISKRKSKRKLGHVVRIQVGRLPYTWPWISLVIRCPKTSIILYNKHTMLRSSLQSPFSIISFSILQKRTFKWWPRLTWPMILE